MHTGVLRLVCSAARADSVHWQSGLQHAGNACTDAPFSRARAP